MELDALDPDLLKQMIYDAIMENFDQDIYREVLRLEKVLKRRLQKRVNKIKKLLSL
ncbi:MAG: hypothetical protein ACTSYS_13915 [Promethearchaeota archaeon]